MDGDTCRIAYQLLKVLVKLDGFGIIAHCTEFSSIVFTALALASVLERWLGVGRFGLLAAVRPLWLRTACDPALGGHTQRGPVSSPWQTFPL